MTNRRDIEWILEWLTKSDHDRVAMRAILSLPDIPTDVVCFHAQQAIEKAMKAVLVVHGEEPEHTHDLVALHSEVIRHIPALDEEEEALADLDLYAVRIRYPGKGTFPTLRVAQQAVQLAERLCEVLHAYVNERLTAMSDKDKRNTP